ncbi:MAG: tRNA (adenine(22)-N(1))-methyltransferase TrmK [Bacillaceae bacterium]|nr:tRNA (adenine(22)-N(1))-methyltransferase TrmK [Bacillaceae bacterium]
MDQFKLSARLQSLANYIPSGSRFADIGTDHAYLPCYVCLHDPDARAVAGELNDGPFQAARQQVNDLNLEDRIDVRQGDGLSILKSGEVDTIVIAGMGGKLITSILDQGQDRLKHVEKLVLQPNVDAHYIRRWLYSHGFSLEDEVIMNEEGYFYEILVAVKNANARLDDLSEKEQYFGPILLKKNGSIFKAKWATVLKKKRFILEQMEHAKHPDTAKMNMFKRQVDWIKEVLNYE